MSFRREDIGLEVDFKNKFNGDDEEI